MGLFPDFYLTRFMDDVSEASLAGVLTVVHELIGRRAALCSGKVLSGRVDTRRGDHGTSGLGSNPCAAGNFVDERFPNSINDVTITKALLSDEAWSGAHVQIRIGSHEYDEDWTISITRVRLVFACFDRLCRHPADNDWEDRLTTSAYLVNNGLVDVGGPHSLGPFGPAKVFGAAAALYLNEKLHRLEVILRGMRAIHGEYLCRSSVALRNRLQEILASNPVLASTRELRSRGAMKHFVRDCDEWILNKLGEVEFAELIERSVGVALDKWLLAGRKSVMIPA